MRNDRLITHGYEPYCCIEGWGVALAAGAAVAGVAGAVIEGNAAKSAANTQAQAAESAQQISKDEFNTIQQQNQPYIQAGYGALSELEQGLGIGGQPGGKAPGTRVGAGGSSGSVPYGSLTAPFTTQNWQQLSPAYNFELGQGQSNVLGSESAGNGALSGSALKDLTSFNQGEASSSFNNAFNMYSTQQNNIFNRLTGIAGIGENAANFTGAQGTTLAGQQAQSATNVGTALAGGTVGAANAYAGGLSSLSGALPWLYAGSGGSGSSPYSYGASQNYTQGSAGIDPAGSFGQYDINGNPIPGG